jgi:poly-gamma-glutamate synthesis protein (capsule biosynthesis protein)
VPAAWAAGPARSGVALLAGLDDAAADTLAAGIERARRALGHGPGQGPVLLSIHWGDNWVERVPEAHRRFAHRLIDLGAVDVVQGHSSHHPLPIEVYRDRLILYGCGDLMNDYAGIGAHGSLRSDVGVLYAARLDAGSGRLQALELVPLQSRRLRLERADNEARRWLAELLSQGGRPLGTSLATAAGNWQLQWEAAT